MGRLVSELLSPPSASIMVTKSNRIRPNHEWSGSHREYNNGANDGFITENDPMGERAMGYFDRTDIPFYWDLAERFAISDHHHCSMLGPTWTNREYYLSGTSFGQIENVSIPSERYTAGADGDHIPEAVQGDAVVPDH